MRKTKKRAKAVRSLSKSSWGPKENLPSQILASGEGEKAMKEMSDWKRAQTVFSLKIRTRP